MTTITSRQHPFVSRCRSAATRRDPAAAEVLLDGAHLVEAALAAGLALEAAAATPAGLGTAEVAALWERLGRAGAERLVVSASVMDAASPVRTPTGLLAIGRARIATLDAVLAGTTPLVVGVAGVQDPGNVGAIIRAADAAGATGVVVTEGSADPFGWKALRGSMGSTCRVAVAAGGITLQTLLEAARARRVRAVATAPGGAPSLYEHDLTGPVLVLLGGEGAGLTAGALAEADGRLTIPMAPGVESLNVSVAAGVILFEARRQRTAAAGRGPR